MLKGVAGMGAAAAVAMKPLMAAMIKTFFVMGLSFPKKVTRPLRGTGASLLIRYLGMDDRQGKFKIIMLKASINHVLDVPPNTSTC